VGLVSSMLIGIMFVSGLSGAYAAGKIIMKIGHSDATDVFTSRKHAQLIAFKELVNSGSGGRIEVQVFGGGSIGGEREITEAVIAGTMQGTSVSGAFDAFYPPAMVLGIPFLFTSAPAAWEMLDGPFGKKLSDGLVKKTGLRNLCFAEVGFRNFTNSKRPIRTPADLKGLKIRVQETPLYMTMIKSLGANPTGIPWPETYMALQTGVADGQENPVSVILNNKLQEVQKYLTLDGHVYGVDWFVVNEKFYQSLPKDLQAIVNEAAKISATVGRGVQELNSAIGIAKLQQAEMQIYVPTPQEKALFKQATQGPVVQWLKTKIDPKLVDETLQAAAKANKLHP